MVGHSRPVGIVNEGKVVRPSQLIASVRRLSEISRRRTRLAR